MAETDERLLVAYEARRGGLREPSRPSLEAVDHRRAQLWMITFAVMAGLAIGLVLMTVGAQYLPDEGVLRLPAFRIGLLLIILGLAAYVLEKETHLRRLTHLLIDERVLTAALSNRLTELTSLARVGKAINSVLTLDETLDIILANALDLLGGETGSIMLAGGPDRLRAVSVRGGEDADPVPNLRDGVAAWVAEEREAVLIAGRADHVRFGNLVDGQAPDHSVMSVPLVNRGELLGVLNVVAPASRAFSEYDLRVLTLFAEHAAIAIANARHFEAEREHVAELVALDRLKSEFVATVSHELRTPLTSILGGVQTMRRRDLSPEQAQGLLEVIERQGRRLLRLIEEVLVVQRAESGMTLDPRPVDVVAAVAGLARVLDAAGREVAVRLPADVHVLADPEALDQILFNLVDNAFKHGGGGPVEVVVEDCSAGDETVRLSVLDRGPGVPPELAGRLFDRFVRGGEGGGGMGLGLYLVHRLTEAQGGSVSVRERPGGGAAFDVVLPTARRGVEVLG